ncbi:hypothetical protein ACFV1W_15670 [Kitasatospora sp. NPDC059648]|uniref:hypothetical protein n=1 Tax=Kitasatospora sp. NPDC059648 TaxID=3346894 RepID=UPI003694CE69
MVRKTPKHCDTSTMPGTTGGWPSGPRTRTSCADWPGGEYSFVWHAIARNAAAPADLLVPLAARRHSSWIDNCLLRLVAAHPALTGAELDGLVPLLAARLEEGERPYAAVLELARRPEPAAGPLRRLGHLPGASARLRRGIARALAARPGL